MDLLMTIPLFVTLAKMTRRRGFRRWATTLALFAGILAQYALVLIPTASCGGCPGGALTGSAFAFVFLLVAGFRKVFYPGPIADHLALGALVAVVPAAYSGSGESSLAALRGAAIVEGPMGEGVAPPDVLADEASGASVFTLREPQMSNFRFDLMGESHSTLPLPDARYAYKAGKLEQGTFCAVPVVGDGWTVADPVPMWYVCENDWREFVSCRGAYEGAYDEKDWYGWRRLRDCLRKPEELWERWLIENPIMPPPPPSLPSPPPTPPSPPSPPPRPPSMDPPPPPVPAAPPPPTTAPPPPEPPEPPTPPTPPGQTSSDAPPPPSPAAPTATDAPPGEAVPPPPILPPAPPTAPSPPPPYVAPKIFRMYFYALDFLNSYNEFVVPAQTAIERSSMEHRVRVLANAPRVRLADEQTPCCDAQAAAVTAASTNLSLMFVMPIVVARVALTVFRTFVPEKRKSHRSAFLTRAELKRIKLA